MQVRGVPNPQCLIVRNGGQLGAFRRETHLADAARDTAVALEFVDGIASLSTDDVQVTGMGTHRKHVARGVKVDVVHISISDVSTLCVC